MSKLKKRLQVKRKQTRKVVKHRPNNGNVKTPEQQAKENEMLKIMLSRPQPQIIGQTQQNDKLQQQLESVNKLRNEEQRRYDSLKNQIKMAQDQTEEIKSLRNQLKDQEQMERRHEEGQQKIKELKENLAKYTEGTVEYRHQQFMDSINEEIENIKDATAKAEAEQKRDKMWNDLQTAKTQKEELEAQLAIVNGVFESEEWKKRYEQYVETSKNNMLLKMELKRAEEIAKIEEDNLKTQAQIDANKELEQLFNAPRHRVVRNKDGSKRLSSNGKGGYAYEKDGDGNEILYDEESISNVYKRSYANASKKLADSKVELTKYQTKVNNITKLITKVEDMKSERNLTNMEQKAMKSYIESDDFKMRHKELEELANKEMTEKLKRDIVNSKNETLKRVNDIKTRTEIASRYGAQSQDSSEILTQIQALGEQAIRIETRNKEVVEENAELTKARDKFQETLESLVSRYKDPYHEMVRNNIIYLIRQKTGNKLKDEILDNSKENLNKATEFINHISQFDYKLLTDGDMIDGFMASNQFKNFKWDVI